jgi:hypothetical protein
MIDRQADAVGDHLHDGRVVVAEVALGEGPDVEDAEQAAFDDQRHAEQRDDLLLVKEGIDGLAGGEVANRNRAPLGRDAAGKALADRDTEANLDLLLEPPGSASGKLVRLLVEKKDRRRVDVEDLDDADEKRREKPVEVQVRKSRLGDPLEVPGKTRGRSTGATQNQESYEL